MATFNTYDYDFLVKCLGQGSSIFKAESLKRLNTLAGADKKQFVNHLKPILTETETLYKEDKEQINHQSILLLNEIITNVPHKELAHLLYTKHLPLIVPALGHASKSSLRKAAHTVLLNSVKNYPQFNTLGQIYLANGFLSEVQLVQQKSINSFQSILILEAKHFDWDDDGSKKLVQTLIDKIQHQNLFISKAASQCILSICKMEGIKKMVKRVGDETLLKLKKFLDDILQKLPSDNFFITPNDIVNLLESNNKGTISIPRYDTPRKKELAPDIKASAEDKDLLRSNNSNHRRLEKIKRSIKIEEKKVESKEMIGGKLFSFVTGEGSLKERTQAIQDLLFKIQVSKHKPQFEPSMRSVFPILLKMLKDSNPKIVSLTLRILENCIEWIATSQQQLNNLVSIIVEKLGDQKISIRQNVSKVIKDLAVKTNRAVWVRELLENLKKNTSAVLKDETLYLIHHIYETCPHGEQINVPTAEILDQISYYTDDPKTKIKIRTLDCLSVIVYHSKEPEKYNFTLKSKMSSVFYQMFLEKVGKLQEEALRKKKVQHQRKNRRERDQKTTQQHFRTHYRDQTDAKSEGDVDSEGLNVSMQTIKKRVSFLRKPRHHQLSTQETISVDNSYHRQSQKGGVEDVEIMLPSLYKKAGNKFNSTRKGVDFSPTKTIESKQNQGDYLTKEDLKPLRDPQKQMKVILSDLKSNDWKIQFESTNKLRRLIEFHPDMIVGSSSASIHALVLDMISMAENLRSSVAKNSLICIYEFVQLMGRQIDSQSDILLEKLLKRSADTNSFISQQVQRCLSVVALNANPLKVFQKLACFRDSKSIPIKESIVSILIAMKDNQKVREKDPSKIAESLAFYLADGQAQIRTRARTGIIQLAKELGDWYRALRGKINPIYFKSICELMTKPTPMRKEELHQTLQPRSMTLRQQLPAERVQKMEAPPTKRKPAKVSQFPNQFNEISSIMEGSNSSDWRKRIQAIERVKQIALKYPQQFVQFRSAPHFADAICKQVIQPNIKVSTNSINTLLQIFEPLRLVVENNLGIICNSVFAGLGSNKPQIREASQKCIGVFLDQIDIQLILQHLCHGILYALPRSRLYLLTQLETILEHIYDKKKQLLFKHVFPLLNKLMDEYKSELMPTVVTVFDRLYELLGNLMFNHLTKFKEVRELLQK